MTDRLKFNYGVTLNMTNYESARIDIGLEQDVPPGKTVEDKLQEMVDYVLGEVTKLAKDVKRGVR